MAVTPEAKVKARVVKQLKARGVYYFYPVTGGYGGSGVPDIIICSEGYFVAIECKAGKNKPTKLQNKNLADIIINGGHAVVVNEENADAVGHYLDAVSIRMKERANGSTK